MSEKAVTLKDVAAAANVSRATAARALNSYGYVRGETAERVRAVAERLGYQTNLVAQALRSGQLPIVGFVLGDIRNPFFARISNDLEGELRKLRYHVVIGSSAEDVEQEKELLESLRALSIRGFILAPASTTNSSHIAELAREGVPIVLIDRIARGVHADTVIVDNEGGTREAIDYLVAQGHRRIGVLRDESRIFTSQERLRGYEKSLKSHGIAPDESLISVSHSTVEHAIDATIRLFSRRNRPTALFTVDSLLTQGALLGLRSMGLSIPGDVSLIGFDDFDLATFTDPQITVVAQPTSDIGPLAAQLLLERLSGEESAPRQIRFPTRLITRGSVARPTR